MSGRILIVDDNPLNVKLLATRLAREYYAVSTAGGGVAAVAAAQNDPPDLVLLDIMMPDLNGFEVCRQLRADARTRHVPVIMVTALSDSEDRIKGLEAGAQDFLSKPIHDVALLARVRSQLRLKLVMDEWRMRQSSAIDAAGERHEEFVDADKPRILAVIDDSMERAQIDAALGASGARLRFADTIAAARELALAHDFDVVICSLTLTREDGLNICPALRGQEKTRHLPILLLDDAASHDRVARGLDLGANDYLLRPLDPVELAVRIGNQVRFMRSYEQLRQSYATGLALALTDSLTGIYNRRYFDGHLPRLMRHCRRINKPLALLVVDADHFKKVNDEFGHAAGDAVLRALAQRLQGNLRPLDFVARFGGEEFVAVLTEADIAAARMIAVRLRETVCSAPFDLPAPDPPQTVTISIGGAMLRPDDTPASLFRRADEAVYTAKQTGRNCVIMDVSSDMADTNES